MTITTLKTTCYLLSFSLIILLSGCTKEDESVRKYQLPKSPPEQAETPPAPAIQSSTTMPQTPEIAKHESKSGWTWKKPDSWQDSQGSSMRMASFSVPAGDETGDCSVMTLGGMAGGIDANINRWRGQIGLPEQSSEEIAAAYQKIPTLAGKCIYVKLINEAKPESAILAAMIPQTAETLFVKCTASKAAVEKIEPEFIEFCKSLEKND